MLSWPGAILGALFVLIPLLLWSTPGSVLVVFLAYIWLLAGRSDPGDLLAAYPIIRWGSYLLIPALALPVLARAVRRGFWRRTPIDAFVAMLAGIILLSGYLHNSTLGAIAASLAIYLRYPLFFVLLVNLDLADAAYRRALWVTLGIGGALCIEAIVNYAAFGKQHDGTFFSVGIAYGTQPAGMFFLYGMSVAAAHALRTHVRPVHVLALILVLLAAWIASVRSIALLLAPLCAVIYSVHRGWLTAGRLPALALLLVIALCAAALAPWRPPENTQGIAYKLYPGYRFDVDKVVFAALAESRELALGAGPRSFSPGSLGPMGRIHQLVDDHYHKTLRLPDVPPPNEIATSLSELGIVGFAVSWLMLLPILQVAARLWERCARSAPAGGWTIVTLAFIGVWFYYAIFGLSYCDLWRVDASSFLFWTAAAAIYGEQQRWASAVV